MSNQIQAETDTKRHAEPDTASRRLWVRPPPGAFNFLISRGLLFHGSKSVAKLTGILFVLSVGILAGFWVACAIVSAAITEDAWVYCGLLTVAFLSGMASCFLILLPGARHVED